MIMIKKHFELMGLTFWERYNVPQVLLTGFVTFIVTIAGSMILTNIQNREPRLVFSTSDTIPFAGENQVMGIYHIRISNEGKKATNNVVCHICLLDTNIEQWDISADPALKFSEILTNDSLELSFPILNPSETLQISILATNDKSLPNKPEISLRAEGVSGSEKQTTDVTSFLNQEVPDEIATIIIALSSAFAGLFALTMTGSRLRGSYRGGDQNRVLAFLFGNYGLKDEMEKYLEREKIVAYWSEADKLGVLAKSSDDTMKNIYKSILKDILVYAPKIAKKSKGIIYYNIARIEAIQGNDAEKQKNISEAKKLMSKKEIENRMKIDPIFRNLSPEIIEK